MHARKHKKNQTAQPRNRKKNQAQNITIAVPHPYASQLQEISETYRTYHQDYCAIGLVMPPISDENRLEVINTENYKKLLFINEKLIECIKKLDAFDPLMFKGKSLKMKLLLLKANVLDLMQEPDNTHSVMIQYYFVLKDAKELGSDIGGAVLEQEIDYAYSQYCFLHISYRSAPEEDRNRILQAAKKEDSSFAEDEIHTNFFSLESKFKNPFLQFKTFLKRILYGSSCLKDVEDKLQLIMQKYNFFMKQKPKPVALNTIDVAYYIEIYFMMFQFSLLKDQRTKLFMQPFNYQKGILKPVILFPGAALEKIEASNLEDFLSAFKSIKKSYLDPIILLISYFDSFQIEIIKNNFQLNNIVGNAVGKLVKISSFHALYISWLKYINYPILSPLISQEVFSEVKYLINLIKSSNHLLSKIQTCTLETSDKLKKMEAAVEENTNFFEERISFFAKVAADGLKREEAEKMEAADKAKAKMKIAAVNAESEQSSDTEEDEVLNVSVPPRDLPLFEIENVSLMTLASLEEETNKLLHSLLIKLNTSLALLKQCADGGLSKDKREDFNTRMRAIVLTDSYITHCIEQSKKISSSDEMIQNDASLQEAIKFGQDDLTEKKKKIGDLLNRFNQSYMEKEKKHQEIQEMKKKKRTEEVLGFGEEALLRNQNEIDLRLVTTQDVVKVGKKIHRQWMTDLFKAGKLQTSDLTHEREMFKKLNIKGMPTYLSAMSDKYNGKEEVDHEKKISNLFTIGELHSDECYRLLSTASQAAYWHLKEALLAYQSLDSLLENTDIDKKAMMNYNLGAIKENMFTYFKKPECTFEVIIEHYELAYQGFCNVNYPQHAEKVRKKLVELGQSKYKSQQIRKII